MRACILQISLELIFVICRDADLADIEGLQRYCNMENLLVTVTFFFLCFYSAST